MKYVFSNNEIAHAWWHKTNDWHGRTSSGSMFFRDNTIYSYVEDYPIARHYPDKNITLVNNHDCSVTTKSHVSLVLRAITGNYFRVANPVAISKTEHKENYKGLKDSINYYYKKAATDTRNKEYYLSEAYQVTQQANEYSKLFKLGFRAIKPKTDLEEIKKAVKAEQAKQLKLKKARQAKLLAENKERLDAWLTGESVPLPGFTKVYMRVKGDNIETSQGVDFPVEHAKLAFAIVKRCVDNGTAWKRNGHSIKLGYYAVDSISPKGTVKAGCHTVEYDQIERCAKELALI